jgi:hypothetical protein
VGLLRDLGPFLFISYIDDVLRVIRYCRFHIYADDLQIYHTSAVSDVQKCIDELNLDMQRVHEWAAANGHKLNPIKSQVIVISRCRVDIRPPTLLIGYDVIKIVHKVKSLGFVLNEGLTATDHFKKVCQKVYLILRCLKPHASHTPFEVRRRLVVSFIMPHIGYEGIVYAVADVASQRILNMAFRACLRYIHSLRRLNHVYQLETNVSLYVILHELAEGSSKCFKFHYLVSQSILLDTYFLFLPKKNFVSICGVLIFLYQTVNLH